MAEDVTALQIKVLSDGVKEAERRLTALERTARDTETRIKGLENASKGLNTGLRVTSVALGVLGVNVIGLTGSLTAGVAAWTDYDKQMRRVNSISNVTSMRMREMRQEVLDVAQALGIDAKEAAEGLYEIIQADIPEDKAKKFLEVSAKAAVGNSTTIANAVNALKNVVNAYGMDAGRAEEISDKLFTTVLYGGASFEELGNYLSGATVIASSMGVSFEEVLAIITQVTSQGTKTAESVTQVERSIQALINPTEEMTTALKLMGVETGRQAIEQFGLIGTLQRVRQAYGDNDAALVKAMGSVVALQAVLATTGSKFEDTKKALDQVNTSAGATSKAFNASAGTVEQSLNMLKASVVSLVEQMEGSLGAISAFAQAIQGVAVAIKDLQQTSLFGGGGADVQNALGLKGQFGVTQSLQQIRELEARAAELKKLGADASKAGNQGIAPYVQWSAARNEELSNVNNNLERLRKNIEGMSQTDRDLGFISDEINQIVKAQKEATDPKDVDEYSARLKGLREDYMNITNGVKAAADAKAQENLKVEQAAEAEKKRNAELLKAAEAREQELKVLKKVAEGANDLATTQQEKLRAQEKQINLAVKEGLITDEVGKKAIANLQEQIALLDKKDAKAAGGGGGATKKFGTGSSMLGYEDKFADALPELDFTSRNETIFEQLKREEDDLRKSYERRLAIINEAAAQQAITESQRSAYVVDTEAKMGEALTKLEEERRTATLESVKGIFTDLTKIGAAFGKTGFKIAQGAAISEATMNMYAGAVAAYKSAAAVPYVGPYLAPVAAAAALAAGAANIANIKSQSYSGAYEHGGMIPSGKYGIVGEAGAEVVRGPAIVSSARTTKDQFARNGGNGSNTIVQVINNTGAPVREERSKQGDTEMVKIIVGEATRQVAADIRKGGTPIARTMEKQYGLTRGKGGRG